MRLFVGIEFPAAVIDIITEWQNIVRQSSERGRFKRPDNFHLTLKFLGEVDANDVSQITKALNAAAVRARPFTIRLEGLGQFGGGDLIRVVWLGIKGETNVLGVLKDNVETGLEKLGFKAETRRWQPHITLAQDVQLIRAAAPLANYIQKTVQVDVKEYALILSSEQQGRRFYTPIAHFPLSGG
jgi:2'-5' RNA ligase